MNGSDDDPLRPRYRKAVSLSLRLYRALLVAYPREFREQYASEMVRYFGEMCEDAAGRGGLAALVVTWLRTFYELAVSARLERAMTIPQKEIRPHDAVTAAVLLFPGAGQAYNNQWVKSILHLLLIPVSLVSLALLVPAFPGSEWYALLVAAVIWAYSALEAWITARRMKALQRS